eukprot:Awhi_evm1s11599
MVKSLTTSSLALIQSPSQKADSKTRFIEIRKENKVIPENIRRQRKIDGHTYHQLAPMGYVNDS